MNWQSEAIHSLLDRVIEHFFLSSVCGCDQNVRCFNIHAHTQNQTVSEIKILIGNYILLMSERLLRSKHKNQPKGRWYNYININNQKTYILFKNMLFIKIDHG